MKPWLTKVRFASLRSLVLWTGGTALVLALTALLLWPHRDRVMGVIPTPVNVSTSVPAPSSGKIEMRIYRVPPVHSYGSTELPPRPPAKQVLEEVGVQFPPDSQATWDSKKGRLVVFNTRDQLDLIDDFISFTDAPERNGLLFVQIYGVDQQPFLGGSRWPELIEVDRWCLEGKARLLTTSMITSRSGACVMNQGDVFDWGQKPYQITAHPTIGHNDEIEVDLWIYWRDQSSETPQELHLESSLNLKEHKPQLVGMVDQGEQVWLVFVTGVIEKIPRIH